VAAEEHDPRLVAPFADQFPAAESDNGDVGHVRALLSQLGIDGGDDPLSVAQQLLEAVEDVTEPHAGAAREVHETLPPETEQLRRERDDALTSLAEARADLARTEEQLATIVEEHERQLAALHTRLEATTITANALQRQLTVREDAVRAEHERELAELKARLDVAAETADALREQLALRDAELDDAHRRLADALDEEARVVAAVHTEVEAETRHWEATRIEHEREVAALHTELESAAATIAALHQQLADRERATRAHEHELAALQAQLDTATELNAQLEVQLTVKDGELGGVIARLDQAHDEYARILAWANAEAETVHKEIRDQYDRALADLHARLESATTSNAELERQLARRSDELDDALTLLEQAGEEHARVLAAVRAEAETLHDETREEHERQLAALRTRLDTATDAITRLEQDNARKDTELEDAGRLLDEALGELDHARAEHAQLAAAHAETEAVHEAAVQRYEDEVARLRAELETAVTTNTALEHQIVSKDRELSDALARLHQTQEEHGRIVGLAYAEAEGIRKEAEQYAERLRREALVTAQGIRDIALADADEARKTAVAPQLPARDDAIIALDEAVRRLERRLRKHARRERERAESLAARDSAEHRPIDAALAETTAALAEARREAAELRAQIERDRARVRAEISAWLHRLDT
jgi:chromosome segregation ATPase